MLVDSCTSTGDLIPETLLCLFVIQLPIQTGKACVGDNIYRNATAEQFSPERILDCLDLSSEYHALDVANRIEAAIHVGKKKDQKKRRNHQRAKHSSWGGKVKRLVADGDKDLILAQRAVTLLRSLRLRFPSLPQTALDMSKIQYNKVMFVKLAS